MLTHGYCDVGVVHYVAAQLRKLAQSLCQDARMHITRRDDYQAWGSCQLIDKLPCLRR